MKLITFKIERSRTALIFNDITGRYGYNVLWLLEDPTLAIIIVAVENKILDLVYTNEKHND